MDIRSRHQFPDEWMSRLPRPSLTPGVWMDGRIAFLACKPVLGLKQAPFDINTTPWWITVPRTFLRSPCRR